MSTAPDLGGSAQRGRGRREHLADGVVELPDAAEPGGEGHIAHREDGRLQQHPSGLGPLRTRDRDRSCAEDGGHLTLKLAAAVPQAVGEPVDSLAIDDAVGDETESTRDEV